MPTFDILPVLRALLPRYPPCHALHRLVAKSASRLPALSGVDRKGHVTKAEALLADRKAHASGVITDGDMMSQDDVTMMSGLGQEPSSSSSPVFPPSCQTPHTTAVYVHSSFAYVHDDWGPAIPPPSACHQSRRPPRELADLFLFSPRSKLEEDSEMKGSSSSFFSASPLFDTFSSSPFFRRDGDSSRRGGGDGGVDDRSWRDKGEEEISGYGVGGGGGGGYASFSPFSFERSTTNRMVAGGCHQVRRRNQHRKVRRGEKRSKQRRQRHSQDGELDEEEEEGEKEGCASQHKTRVWWGRIPALRSLFQLVEAATWIGHRNTHLLHKQQLEDLWFGLLALVIEAQQSFPQLTSDRNGSVTKRPIEDQGIQPGRGDASPYVRDKGRISSGGEDRSKKDQTSASSSSSASSSFAASLTPRGTTTGRMISEREKEGGRGRSERDFPRSGDEDKRKERKPAGGERTLRGLVYELVLSELLSAILHAGVMTISSLPETLKRITQTHRHAQLAVLKRPLVSRLLKASSSVYPFTYIHLCIVFRGVSWV